MTLYKVFLYTYFLLVTDVLCAELIPIEDMEMQDIHGRSGLSIDFETDLGGFAVEYFNQSGLGDEEQSLVFSLDNLALTASDLTLDVVSMSQGNAVSIGLPERISLDQLNFSFDAVPLVDGVAAVIGQPPPTTNYQLSFDVVNNPFECNRGFLGSCNRIRDRSYDFSIGLNSRVIDSSLYSFTRTSGPIDLNNSDKIYSWSVNPNNGNGGPDAGSARLSLDKGDKFTLVVSVEGCNSVVNRRCEPASLEINVNGSTFYAEGGGDNNEVEVYRFELGYLGSAQDDQWYTYNPSNIELIDVTVNGSLYTNGNLLVFGQ